MKDTWYKCTICGRVGTVGRCCGDETREPLNDFAREEQEKIKSQNLLKAEAYDSLLAEVRAELERHKKSTELLREVEAYLSFRITPDIDNMRKMKADIAKHLIEHFS